MTLLAELGLNLMVGLQEDLEVIMLHSMVIHHCQTYPDYRLEPLLSVANTSQSLQR